MRTHVMYLFWINLILFSVCAKDVHSEEEVVCDPPWQLLHRSCVQFIKTKPFKSWQEARDSCLANNADLLSINDKAEKDLIGPLLREHVKSADLLYWWLGLKLSANGTWYWVDKEELNKYLIDWASNSGKTVSGDGTILTNRCGVLDFSSNLRDEGCEQTKPFICEKIKITPPSTSTTTTTTTTPSSTSTTSTTEKGPITIAPPTPTYKTPLLTNSTTSKPTSTEKPTSQITEFSTEKPVLSTTQTTETITEKHVDKSTENQNNGKASNKPTDQTSESPSSKLTDIPTVNPTDESAGKHTDKTDKPDKSTGKPSDKPTNKPTVPPETTQSQSTTIAAEQLKPNKDEFVGCYAVNLETTCPPVVAFGVSWPRTEPGKMAIVRCDKGDAKWKCDKKPTCWRDEPDVKQCTSEAIQDLTNQMESVLADPNNSTKAIEFTENLASSAGPDAHLSEQDIYQSTKLMNAAAQAKPKNSTEAKSIIKNVAKCGSNLVANDKKNTWSSMTPESQRTVASSLLNSMETVSIQMLNSFNAPTVETIQEENMAIQLQVVNVNDQGPDPKPIEYEGDANTFAIPVENLKKFSSGGLARLVFISYDNIGQLLVPEDDDTGDVTEQQLISRVLSASIGQKNDDETLSEPITFTMNTQDRAKNQEWKQLCSFWNFSLGYTGAWSQQGCSLKKYNSTHTTCQCSHLTNFAILMDIHSTKLSAIHATTLSYITYVGIIISIICLFLAWLTFVCLSIRCLRGSRSSLGMGEGHEIYGTSSSNSGSTAGSRSAQGERNSIHKHLVFCLFIAEVLFLAGIERTDNKIACSIIAGFLHYFFLAGFTWMFVEGIHILFMLVQVFDAAKSRLKYYYVIGYGVPLITCGVSALVYYEGYGTERYCWLTSERMFIWSFAGPVAFILVVNLMILIYAMSAVCKHSEYVFTKDKSKTGNIKFWAIPAFAQQTQKRLRKHQAWIQGAMALEVLLGLTWVFGYFYISEEAIPMAYLFTIFNSLQGLFIFIFHCILNKKVRKEYQRFISYPRRPVSSATHSSSKGFHHMNGSGPQTASYNMSAGRKSSAFVDLNKERKQSTKSTTSA